MRRTCFHLALFAVVFAFGRGTRVVAQTTQAPAREWTLEDVLAAVLSQHPLIEAARAQLTAAEGSRQTASTLPNPVATYWVENARFPGQTLRTPLEPETSAYATLPLEFFLQRQKRVAQASGELRAAQASVATAEQRVAADAIRAFYRVALAQASLDAMTENRAAIEQLVEYLQNRVSQGAAPEGELIRTQVERDRIETDATLADVELVRARAALRPFLGDPGPSNLRVIAAGRERAMLAPLPELTVHALAQRPELLAQRATVDAASAAAAVERSLVVRQLGGSFGLKRTAGVNAMVGGLSLTVPLFDRNRGEIQRATGERLAAEQELRWMERSITSEVEAEYQAAERLAARVSALQPSFLGRAEESRRIALGAYQEGATSLLQALDASRALSDARLTYARAVAAADESLFDLGVAAGYDARTATHFGRSGAPTTGARPDGGNR